MHLLSPEKNIFFNGDMLQVFGTLCFFSRTFLKQLASHVSLDTLQMKVPGMKLSNPCQTCSDLIYIYEFDNAIAFKLKIISLFWYLDKFLEKDKSGLLFQINIAWSVFTGLIS